MGKELKSNPNFQSGHFEEALKETFLLMDVLIASPEGQRELCTMKKDQQGDSYAGCTANVVLINNNTIYCANAGDSRCILWQSSKKKVLDLSHDHKPDNTIEKNRIA